jgi:hypothetical protein
MIPALLVSLVRVLRAWLRGRPALALALLASFASALVVAVLLRPGPEARVSASTVAAASVAPPTSSPPTPMIQLQRALEEAQRNCEVARARARGAVLLPAGPLFRTVELETALLENPWVVDRALGEVDTLLTECAWLADLEAGSTLDGGRTWEDVRFLLGGVHWYLERAWDAGARSEVALRASRALAGAAANVPLPEPRRHAVVDDHDRTQMRELRDVATFEDLLGIWD